MGKEATYGMACERGGEIVDYTIGLCSCGKCPVPRPDWAEARKKTMSETETKGRTTRCHLCRQRVPMTPMPEADARMNALRPDLPPVENFKIEGGPSHAEWCPSHHEGAPKIHELVASMQKRIEKLETVASAARDDLASYKTIGDAPTGRLYMAVAGIEAERRLIVLRDALNALAELPESTKETTPAPPK